MRLERLMIFGGESWLGLMKWEIGIEWAWAGRLL